MADGLAMPATRLEQNDGVEINGIEYRVIRAYEPMFTEGLELTVIANYTEGIQKIVVAKDELIKVIDLAFR